MSRTIHGYVNEGATAVIDFEDKTRMLEITRTKTQKQSYVFGRYYGPGGGVLHVWAVDADGRFYYGKGAGENMCISMRQTRQDRPTMGSEVDAIRAARTRAVERGERAARGDWYDNPWDEFSDLRVGAKA